MKIRQLNCVITGAWKSWFIICDLTCCYHCWFGLISVKEFRSLPKTTILCIILFTYIATSPWRSSIRKHHGLIRKHLYSRKNKEVTTDTLVELADILLKNNYFHFPDKTFRPKLGIAIGTKSSPFIFHFVRVRSKRIFSMRYRPKVLYLVEIY